MDAKNAVTGVASKAAAGAQRMAGLEPQQGIHLLQWCTYNRPHMPYHIYMAATLAVAFTYSAPEDVGSAW